MGGLHPIDILILSVVSALSVLIIILRVRGRRKAKKDIKRCGGECSNCRMSCSSDLFKNDSEKK